MRLKAALRRIIEMLGSAWVLVDSRPLAALTITCRLTAGTDLHLVIRAREAIRELVSDFFAA